MDVADVVVELRAVAGSFSRELLAADPRAAARRPAPQTWSPKEVLGHLIDSAANNHQRFVRTQEAGALRLPGYEQNHWVRSQGYQEADWTHLVALWTHLNLHLADVIARIPADRYQVPCTIGESEPVTLEFVIVDYLGHITHHIPQIRDRLASR